MEQKYMISVDWFQVTCTRNPMQCLSEGMFLQGVSPVDSGNPLIYSLHAPREFNALFGNCLQVQLHGFPLASLYLEPRKGTLKENVCMMKIANPLLYSGRFMWYVSDLLAALKWKFQNISRLDVCCDFNYFAGELQPNEFIQRYMSNGNPWEGGVSYYRVGSNKYAMVGKKVVEDIENESLSEFCCRHRSEYLRFGSRSTGVCTYLYNKSKELDESGRKRYIRELWQKFGLQDTPAIPVFRLEFSILPSAMSVKRQHTDEDSSDARVARGLKDATFGSWSISTLALSDVLSQQSVENVFWGYASKYFRFKIVGTQKYPHNWHDVVLFDVSFKSSLKPYKVSRDLESGVAERNAANLLGRQLVEDFTLSLEDRVCMDRVIEILETRGHFRRKSLTKKQIVTAMNLLSAGHSWDEVRKMNVMSAGHIDLVRDVIATKVGESVEEIMSDAGVRRAVTELDATLSMIQDDAPVIAEFAQSYE